MEDAVTGFGIAARLTCPEVVREQESAATVPGGWFPREVDRHADALRPPLGSGPAITSVEQSM